MQGPFPSLCEINRWGWRSWERTKRQQGLLLLLPGVLKVIRSPISWLLLCFCAKRCQIKKTNEKKLPSIVWQECTKDCRNLAIIFKWLSVMKFDQNTLKAWNKSKHPLPPVSPHLLQHLHFCSLSFWPACPQYVYEKRGSWQVAVCKGIEVYEIFTKAIMTPWTGWVVEKSTEKRQGEEQREWRRPVFFFCLLLSKEKKTKQRKIKEAEQTPPDIRWWLNHQTVELSIVFVSKKNYMFTSINVYPPSI